MNAFKAVLLLLILAGIITLVIRGPGFDVVRVDSEPVPVTALEALDTPASAMSGRPAPDFALKDHLNGAFRLSEHRGRVVVLYFGYTHCPDACPRTVAHLKNVGDALGSQIADYDFVFVTIDPERDTAERLTEFLHALNPNMVGLYGDRKDLQAVWNAYGVHVERVSAPEFPGGYRMRHSWAMYVVDRNGILHVLDSPVGDPPETTADILRKYYR